MYHLLKVPTFQVVIKQEKKKKLETGKEKARAEISPLSMQIWLIYLRSSFFLSYLAWTIKETSIVTLKCVCKYELL